MLELSLVAKDIGAAYGAAHGVSVLSRGETERAEASHLMARVFMAAGDISRAHSTLAQLPVDYAKRPAVIEDIAACLMATDKDQEAQNLLLSLGSAKLSPEARAVLAYLEKKLTNKLYS